MKYKNLKTTLYFIFSILLVASCEQSEIGPLENNTTPPNQIENVVVENIPGGAKLTYTLPNNQDLLYVKAEYTIASGEVIELKSSYYKNYLIIEGFADENEHEIKLYSVNRSEILSEALIVKIKPLEAPIWEIYRKFNVQPAFGGIYLSTVNKSRADIALLIMQKDEYGDWIIDDKSIYTATDSINRPIRPYSTEPQEFAFAVRDRWLNTTDTLFTTIQPFEETPLPKSNYRSYVLPGDTKTHTRAIPSEMWDGDFIGWGSPGVFLTDKTQPGQHMVTFDIGTESKLSRIEIWDYPEYFNGRSYYYIGNLKKFEIWGSSEPNPDGSLDDSWYRLGSYNAVKPSGLPYGEQSSEDYETARAGFSWDFDPAAPAVRYLRIKSIENWGGTGSIGIAEVQVYGAPN